MIFPSPGTRERGAELARRGEGAQRRSKKCAMQKKMLHGKATIQDLRIQCDSEQAATPQMEQDPTPLGSPHVPQGPGGSPVADAPSPPTANTENFFSRFSPPQDGHFGVDELKTIVSNGLLHFRHTNSKMGISLPLKFSTGLKSRPRLSDGSV